LSDFVSHWPIPVEVQMVPSRPSPNQVNCPETFG
jgi:hypothetical protein